MKSLVIKFSGKIKSKVIEFLYYCFSKNSQIISLVVKVIFGYSGRAEKRRSNRKTYQDDLSRLLFGSCNFDFVFVCICTFSIKNNFSNLPYERNVQQQKSTKLNTN